MTTPAPSDQPDLRPACELAHPTLFLERCKLPQGHPLPHEAGAIFPVRWPEPEPVLAGFEALFTNAPPSPDPVEVVTAEYRKRQAAREKRHQEREARRRARGSSAKEARTCDVSGWSGKCVMRCRYDNFSGIADEETAQRFARSHLEEYGPKHVMKVEYATCTKECDNPHGLSIHKARMHPDPDTAEFVCRPSEDHPGCGRRLRTQSGFKNHRSVCNGKGEPTHAKILWEMKQG